MKLLILLITITLTLPSVYPESSNETHFIATNEFQEIKPGILDELVIISSDCIIIYVFIKF